MTQKYKKNNSPAIQNSIFSDFPGVLQPNLSGFPNVSQPDLSGFPDDLQPNLSDFPDVSQPNLSGFPDVFWFRYGATCLAFQKNMGDLGSEVAHTGYVENISCFRG